MEGQHFYVETDHRPLEFLRKEPDDAQLIRVWEAMEPYHYTLMYKPGAEHQNADALSRTEEYEHEAGQQLREIPSGTIEPERGETEDDSESPDLSWAIHAIGRMLDDETFIADLRSKQRNDKTWR